MRAKTIGLLFAALQLALPLPSGAAEAPPRSRSVDCSAIKENFKVCPTYAVGNVKLVRQFSLARCLRDVNWGTPGDGSVIWVKDGCRGWFSVDRGTPYAKPLPEPVTCSSKDWAYEHCATPTWGHRITVKEQLSKTVCTHGENWGFDFAGIWVIGGCSAAFAVD